MSTVTVQLFASYADAFGASTIQIQLEDGSTVADLLSQIRSQPAGQVLPGMPRVAVNRKFASPSEPVAARDEIALIPPVAGG